MGRRRRRERRRARRCSSPASRRCACTTPTCTTCGWSSDRRELFIRIVQALARRRSSSRSLYFWFPALDHRPRRVHDRRGPGDHARHRLAGRVRVAEPAASARASGCCSSAPAPAAVTLARELFERRHELGVEIVGFVDPDPARVGTPLINPASSAPSTTSRRSSARAASIAWWSAWPTRAASCRWTSCSR